MPTLYSVSDLKPGMRLNNNIVNKFSVLLAEGHELTESDIASLERLIPDRSVYIADPFLDEIVNFDDVSHAQTVARTIQEKTSTVIDKINSIARSGQSITSKDVDQMAHVVKDSVKYIVDNPVTMALIEQSKSWENYLQEHSSNVFYLSLLIGNKIRTYIKSERIRMSSARFIVNPTDLAPLGTAALFHDIGMVEMVEVYHKENLNDIEKKMLWNHPHSGASMLPDSIDAVVRSAIRDHHENHIGTGYPDGLAGGTIGIFSRIIRVADAYCSAISKEAGQEGNSEALILYEMLYGKYKRYYDPEILTVFGSLMPPFPVGAKLKLQDGRYAVVVRHNQLSPFQPEVIIAYDVAGNKLPREELTQTFKLGECPEARIESFGNTDFSFLNESIYNLNPVDKYESIGGFSFP